MARCNCSGQTCGCRITEGAGVTITGAGTPTSPWVISAEGGGGGTSGWAAGDRKETYRTVTDAGWLECNGQAVSRSTYADLFAAIGTAYGAGNGTTTFNLPNEAGRVALGAGSGYPQGATGGNAETTLTIPNLPVHTHGMVHTHSIAHDHAAFDTNSGGTHTHKLQLSDTGSSNSSVAKGQSSGTDRDDPVETTGGHVHRINVPSYVGNSGASSLSQTDPTGSGQAFSNLPPYRAMRVLIKT